MNFAGLEADQNQNVISLFGNSLPETIPELFTEFNDEFDLELEDKTEELEAQNVNSRVLVTSAQFPDQSMYTLDRQLKDLKDNLNRLKFYMSDLKDSLPM